MTPLGLPVVPEVYSRVTGSDGLIAATARVTGPGSAASRCAPATDSSVQLMNGASAGQAASSRTMTLRNDGSCDSTCRQRASSPAPSITAIVASQLPAMNAICSGASVA